MIFDKISRRGDYAEMADLSLVLEYLSQIDAAHFPEAAAELDGRRVFVNPVALTTKSEADAPCFESHVRYADVHYIVEGCEKILVSDLDETETAVPYDEEKDVAFSKRDGGTVCILHPGDFLVCSPHDAHCVALAVDAPVPVRKLVGKIRVR